MATVKIFLLIAFLAFSEGRPVIVEENRKSSAKTKSDIHSAPISSDFGDPPPVKRVMFDPVTELAYFERESAPNKFVGIGQSKLRDPSTAHALESDSLKHTSTGLSASAFRTKLPADTLHNGSDVVPKSILKPVQRKTVNEESKNSSWFPLNAILRFIS